MVEVLSGPFLKEGASRWSIRANTKSGPLSLAGSREVSRSDGGGMWSGVVGSIPLTTKDDILYWRAMETLFDGGVESFILPSCESRTAPWPIVDGKPVIGYSGITHSDGTLHSDGTGYAQPSIVALTVGGLAYRATSITFDFGLGGPLVGGEPFDFFHANKSYRRYSVGRVVDNEDGTQTCTIRPPLREAVPAGSMPNFGIVKCLVQLETPNAMDLDIALRKFASPSLAFVEAPF